MAARPQPRGLLALGLATAHDTQYNYNRVIISSTYKNLLLIFFKKLININKNQIGFFMKVQNTLSGSNHVLKNFSERIG